MEDWMIHTKNSKRYGRIRWIKGKDGGYSWINAEDSARGLGLVVNDEVAWGEVNRVLKSVGYEMEVTQESYIPENFFFRMALAIKTPAAIEFKDWIADNVLHKIFREGKYDVAEDDYVQQVVATVKMREAATEETKLLNSVVSEHIVIARNQGDQRDERWVYSWVARRINKTAGLPMRGGRPKSTMAQAAIVLLANGIAREEFNEGVARKRNYRLTEMNVDNRLTDFQRTLPKSFNIPLMN